jgi:uncharacterized tellurite resistance protein B-like protein
LIMSLAKVIVSAAWADGQISGDEINSLKDLTFHLPGMTASDWAQIDIYIDSPVSASERQRLVAELEANLKSQFDKDLAIQALESLLQTDGLTSAAEQEVINEIKNDIQNAHVGSWNRLIHSRTMKRSQAVQQAPNRELRMEDFVNNKIYYDVSLELEAKNAPSQISEADLRKLSLAGGLLARIAFADQHISGDENQAIIAALQKHWCVSPTEAVIMAKAAEENIQANLDYYRLTRSFFEVTSEDERVRFLDVLFAVTTSDGRASYTEVEEIRQIARGLLLTHQQFINAKMKLSQELRGE